MTIEQANEYFSSLPEGFAPAEELRAALTADVQKVQFVGVAGTAGKTAAAGCRSGIGPAQYAGLRRHGHRPGRCEPLGGASGHAGRRRHAEGRRLRYRAGAAEGCSE